MPETDKPNATPPGPKPLVPPPSPAKPEDAPASGVAPPKGERLEDNALADRHPEENGGGATHAVQEGQVYSTPDGEERLVWVIRKDGVGYFARREGGRWAPTLDRQIPSVAQFCREVGVG